MSKGLPLERLFDSHCHWDHAQLQALQPQLWQSCLQRGVNDLLVPATQAAHWLDLINLCQQHAHWHLALGLHPYYVDHHSREDLALLARLTESAQAAAVGEIGLDWHLPEPTWAAQEVLFMEQLSLAKQLNLPVILHVRKCHDRVIKILRQKKFNSGGFVHAYSGNVQQAQAYADLGFKLGVGGTITYARASKTRRVIAELPLTWLVLETDAPDMPMAHQSNRLNRPDDLPHVLDALTDIRTESRHLLAQQTTDNVRMVLGVA